MPQRTPQIKIDAEMAEMLADFLDNREYLSDVVDAIEDVSPSSSVAAFTTHVAQQLEIDVDRALPIIFTILNIARGAHRRQEPAKQTLDVLTKEMKQYRREPLNESRLEAWSEVLPELVDAVEKITPDSALMISAKAMSVCYERPFVLHKSQILSDIRPVFNDKATEIQEMVITHTLVVDYSGAGRAKDIHLTLDMEDIASLREQCERAEVKARTIESAMTNLPWNTIIFPESVSE